MCVLFFELIPEDQEEIMFIDLSIIIFCGFFLGYSEKLRILQAYRFMAGLVHCLMIPK